MVIISACHAEDPGSIPGGGVLASGLHAYMLIRTPRNLNPEPDIQNPDPRHENCNGTNVSPNVPNLLAAGLHICMEESIGHPKAAAPSSISGLVVEYIVAIDVTRVRFPADAFSPRAL